MNKRFVVVALATGVASVFLGGADAGTPTTLKVITSGGFAQAYRELLPGFEKETGIKVETGSGASEGVGPKTIRYQLAHGTPADVVILSREGLNRLAEDGRIRKGSAVGLATAPLAAAVRTGAAPPNIATVAAFRQTLIEAGRIVMPGSTSGQFVRDKVFPRLDLPASVTLTLVARGTESVEMLKTGKADLAIGPSSELVNVPGITMIGHLPSEVQIIQTFTAGIVNDAKEPKAAKQLIRYLSSQKPATVAAIRRAGMEPARR
ncbi:substrate-binding domain-containing protein [Sphingomonas sp. KR1UV-12]|uniref:Substrate-binding domain-containing protein n=1 Tax=Sphingomonas aurea TaxID=3063994 RepID=A0ABT9EIN5_9SPHN|nr:substrate-binding domain-containing protein [Sphingomonas sp. KR1UV-12]MDP1026830.1 substrate-binding domain-containing protein [Sphingomonas sp. KR1UV-12]